MVLLWHLQTVIANWKPGREIKQPTKLSGIWITNGRSFVKRSYVSIWPTCTEQNSSIDNFCHACDWLQIYKLKLVLGIKSRKIVSFTQSVITVTEHAKKTNSLKSNKTSRWSISRLLSSKVYFDGLVQDCSISIANALEILQFCTKPSIY